MAVQPQPFPDHTYPQQLPLIDRVADGGLPPWHRGGVSLHPSINGLARTLETRGRSLEAGMPEIDDTVEGVANLESAETRISAVLACLFEEDGEVHLVMTRRASHLRHHRHEVSLPGGRCEAYETPLETALREAQEEIGLKPSSVKPLGFLSPIYTLASSSAIWPVVGVVPSRPEFTVDPSEVDRVFSVSLTHLLQLENFREQRWWRQTSRRTESDGAFRVHFYRVPGDLVWGATARIVTELLTLVTEPTDESRR